VLERAIAQAGVVIEQTNPEEGPADEALRRLPRSSWQVLDRHRRLFDVAVRELGPVQLREHHDPATTRIEKLVARGQGDGAFRTDLPLTWLVTTVYTLLHAAAEDVNAGRLPPDDAGRVLEATVLSALSG
jgi:hypothetical protein